MTEVEALLQCHHNHVPAPLTTSHWQGMAFLAAQNWLRSYSYTLLNTLLAPAWNTRVCQCSVSDTDQVKLAYGHLYSSANKVAEIQQTLHRNRTAVINPKKQHQRQHGLTLGTYSSGRAVWCSWCRSEMVATSPPWVGDMLGEATMVELMSS